MADISTVKFIASLRARFQTKQRWNASLGQQPHIWSQVNWFFYHWQWTHCSWETEKHTNLVTSLNKPPWHYCSSVKTSVETRSLLCIGSLSFSHVQHVPHHSTDITVKPKQNTFFRIILAFINIKNRDLTCLSHSTKQYETNNTMCHYKGINDLLNHIFASSVQQELYIVLCENRISVTIYTVKHISALSHVGL